MALSAEKVRPVAAGSRVTRRSQGRTPVDERLLSGYARWRASWHRVRPHPTPSPACGGPHAAGVVRRWLACAWLVSTWLVLIGCTSAPAPASDEDYDRLSDFRSAFDYCVAQGLIEQQLASDVSYHLAHFRLALAYDQARLDQMVASKRRERTAADCPLLQEFVDRREQVLSRQ